MRVLAVCGCAGDPGVCSLGEEGDLARKLSISIPLDPDRGANMGSWLTGGAAPLSLTATSFDGPEVGASCGGCDVATSGCRLAGEARPSCCVTDAFREDLCDTFLMRSRSFVSKVLWISTGEPVHGASCAIKGTSKKSPRLPMSLLFTLYY